MPAAIKLKRSGRRSKGDCWIDQPRFIILGKAPDTVEKLSSSIGATRIDREGVQAIRDAFVVSVVCDATAGIVIVHAIGEA